ncbi:MAG: AMP-binding protein [Planctomycetota bacterium]|nr:AMP-binding protein [Planctomycetota bacterium]
MSDFDFTSRRKLEQLPRTQLETLQLQSFNALLEEVLPENRFYQTKLSGFSFPLNSLEQLCELPFTTKVELTAGVNDRNIAANITYSLDRYIRFHRTSGTHGKPLAVVDTAQDWKWWIDTWQFVLDAAQLDDSDRALMAFSFGPFIGFWSAYDASIQRGCLVIPTGGLSSVARLSLIRDHAVTAVFCTPSYALRLAEIATEHDMEIASWNVKRIVVAGEPGGSLPAIRQRIESLWRAEVIDHSGASEIGPWGYGDSQGKGLHIVESEFLAEFIVPGTDTPAAPGTLSELVLTTLGRHGSPLIRYRTGDLVEPYWFESGPNHFVFLKGGVLGRADDMMVIRGINIFPSSVEEILRRFPEIVEFRLTASRYGAMDKVTVEIEDLRQAPERVAAELQLQLGLKVDVSCVPIQSLPRFEGKAKRFIDRRNEPNKLS